MAALAVSSDGAMAAPDHLAHRNCKDAARRRGTMALTRIAEAHDLSHRVHSTHIFYPVAKEHASWVLDPSRRFEDVVPVDTVALHLWTSRIRAYTHSPAPENSFMARLQAEGAGT